MAPENSVIGQPLSRLDGQQKVTGAALYAAEFDFPGRVYAVAVQSTIANGEILDMDLSEAEHLPGVLLILTHRNMPCLNPFPEASGQSKPEDRQGGNQQSQSGNQNSSQPKGEDGGKSGGQQNGGSKPEDAQQKSPGKPGQKFLPLQNLDVHYSGQHIGLVVAETLEQAQYAASRIRVSYRAEKPITAIRRERTFDAPSEAGREPNHSLRGDPEGALRSSHTSVLQTYITPVENHNPMEPSATTAVWEGDRLTLYDATQWVSGTANVVAKTLGIPVDNVRVISYFLGGGFGCKGFTWPHTILAAIAARQVARPVTLALTRQQMFTSVGYRAETQQRVEMGAERDGTLKSIRHLSTNITSPFDEFTERSAAITPMLYACPNVRTNHRLARVNKNTPTAMRAPGEAPGSFALECALDELAYALRMDPLELRMQNYAEEDPHKKLPWSSKSLRQCYQLGAEKFGWKQRDPRLRSMRDDLKNGELIGYGMATATYPTNRGAAKARVEMFADGRVRAVSGTQDLGTGTYTVMTQIVADALGVDIRQVRFELGDTRLPQAPVSGGSQTAASVGSAVQAAAQNCRTKLIGMAVADMASPLHGVRAAEVSMRDGKLFLTGTPDRGEPVLELIRRSKRESVQAEGEWKPGDEQKQYSMHAFGAQFAEVRVNPWSGETRVSRFVGVFSAGHILNAKTARSQLMGGIVFGIGMALLEQTVTDSRYGRIVNHDLSEYLVPVNRDVPPIQVFTIDEEDPHVNLVGVKGIGEIGIVGSGAAIANAVFHATGKRIRELPITPDKLLI